MTGPTQWTGARRTVAAVAGTGLAAAALVAARSRGQRHSDPLADDQFAQLPGTTRTVLADDGTALQVTEGGVANAPVTVVFVHGWTLRQECWHYQWRDLATEHRVVAYDQRGHGGSALGSPSSCTIEQVGRDLRAVLAAVAPERPVVLVGHSMGAMAIMALADVDPELFSSRVTAVALISTAATGVAECDLGLPAPLGGVVRRVLPPTLRAVQGKAHLLERAWATANPASTMVTRWISFGPDAQRPLVDFMGGMTRATPLAVSLEFYASMLEHDQRAALRALSRLPVRIIVGEHDVLTPLARSEDLASLLPRATLEVIPGAAHMAILERPEAVTAALRELLAFTTHPNPRPDRT